MGTSKLCLAAAFFALGCAMACVGNEPRDEERFEVDPALKSLPYLGSAPADRPVEGTTRLVAARVFRGLNLLVSQDGLGAVLIDMDGVETHRWKAPPGASIFHTVVVDSSGNLYAAHGRDFSDGFDAPREGVPDTHGLLKLDWHSRQIWNLSGRFSHHIELLPDGGLLTIRTVFVEEKVDGVDTVLADDRIVLVDSAGNPVREVSLLERFRSRVHVRAFANAQGNQRRWRWGSADLLHANTIATLDADHPQLGRKGDWMISVRNLNLVAVLSPWSLETRWEFGPGELVWQHQPTVTTDGSVLVFDNRPNDERSRVVLVDPDTKAITWQYPKVPTADFYSFHRGGVQSLPNGNVLAVLSNQGRAVEVTQEHEVVWEYYTPIRERDPELRMAPYRIERLSPNSIEQFPFSDAVRDDLRTRGYLVNTP